MTNEDLIARIKDLEEQKKQLESENINLKEQMNFESTDNNYLRCEIRQLNDSLADFSFTQSPFENHDKKVAFLPSCPSYQLLIKVLALAEPYVIPSCSPEGSL